MLGLLCREPTWLDVKEHVQDTAPAIHDSLVILAASSEPTHNSDCQLQADTAHMCTLDSSVSCFFLSCVYHGWYGNKHFVNNSDWLHCLIHVRSQVFEKKCALQLTQKRFTDNEFQQVGKSERNFWWKWLHGQERNQAQQKAGEAAFARAQHAEVPSANRFGVLASVFDEVYSSQQYEIHQQRQASCMAGYHMRGTSD